MSLNNYQPRTEHKEEILRRRLLYELLDQLTVDLLLGVR